MLLSRCLKIMKCPIYSEMLVLRLKRTIFRARSCVDLASTLPTTNILDALE